MDNSALLDHSGQIAIIGMAGRFPGARGIDQFWQNLRDGVESVSFFTVEELQREGEDLELLADPHYVRARAVLEGAELFDAAFFGFSPREAEILDPQHRLFLECAWEALECSGYAPDLKGARVGVYAGASINSYYLTNLHRRPELIKLVGDYPTMIANDNNCLATRVSYKLNLKGPSLTVQTACSTSLVAVHLAGQSLLSGECDMALAGGVSVHVPRRSGYIYEEGGINSSDGHCRAFDAQAQGTISGDGVGVVVLKRLEDAFAHGDTIHAIIKGSAVNNDGSLKIGYTAPSVEGQAEVIAEAQALARVAPESISYIEAHGTATPLGDPIEIAALTKVFRAGTQKKRFCAVGSVKTNFGHLDAAAGIAGLIKTVLALQHRQIPASLHFRAPNSQLDLDNSPFYINATLSEWRADAGPRRAGVSSFGIGGTNAHVILEEAPARQPSGAARPWQLLVLSAKTAPALEAATDNLAGYLQQHRDQNIADIAYTLQVGRTAFSHRRVIVCRGTDDAATVLQTREAARVGTAAANGADAVVVFMFPGQGAQHVHMARELYQTERVFREAVDHCSELLKPCVGLDIRDVLYPEEQRTKNKEQNHEQGSGVRGRGATAPLPPPAGGGTEGGGSQESAVVEQTTQNSKLNTQNYSPNTRHPTPNTLDQTQYAQPALFAVEYALARLWMDWGVYPRAMIGHSLGEYVAACLSGVFSLEDALKIVAARGRLMQELPNGAMLSVALSRDQVQPLLNNQVELAAVNGPARCVLSGSTAALELLQAQLKERAIDCQHLHTSHAFHSQMMEPMLEPFIRQLQGIQMRSPAIPFISNLTGTWITAEQATEPGYWAGQLRQTVRFSEGLRSLLNASAPILLEVGPGQTLATFAKQHLDNAAGALILSSLQHPRAGASDCASLTSTLGVLWLANTQIDWPSVHDGETRHRLYLPTYPFQRARYWIERDADEAYTQHTPGRQQSRGDTGLQPARLHDIDEESAMSAMSEKQSLNASRSARFDALVSTLKTIFGQLLGLDSDAIDVDTSFLAVGIDSLLLMQASRMIDEEIGIKLTFRQIIGDFPTINLLASYIDQQLPPEIFSAQPDKTADDNTIQSQTPSTLLDAQTSNGAIEAHSTGNGTLEQIVAQQLQLMSKQIDLLRIQELARQNEARPGITLPNPAQQAGPVSKGAADPSRGENGTTRRSDPEPAPPTAARRPVEPFVPFQPVTPGFREALSPTQQKHLQQLMVRHLQRTQASKRLTQDNRRFLADNRVPAGFSLQTKEIVYPIVAERSSGSRIWDVDGNEYIDLTMGFGVHLFGHAPPFISEALENQIKRGIHLGPQSDLAGRSAELICDLTGVERVTFCNSGTEAVMTALRVARTVTRRNKIALFAGSYHGTFDGVLARSKNVDGKPSATPLAPGVPPQMIEDVLVLEYDSPQSLDILSVHAHQLAAVLVEPVQSRRPDLRPRAFLHQLRQLTEKAGVALIFDDIVTGFRVHPGGTQAWFDISADLVTYGKVVGGGMPIGVVAGKARYMDTIDGGMWNYGDDSYPRADQTMFAGTFCKHPLAMAAAIAVLQHMKASGPQLQQNLNAHTADLVDSLNSHFTQQNLPIRLVHFGSLFRFVFRPELGFIEDLFFYHMLEKGIYVWEGRNCFLSTAHTDADIDTIIQAVKASIVEIQDGGFLPRSAPMSPNPRESVGSPDQAPDFVHKNACAASSLPDVSDELTFPLTAAQKQLWVMTQLGTEASRAYNESVTFHIRGGFDLAALKEAIQTIIRRHESLRTTFDPDGEYQQVHQELNMAVPFVDLAHLHGDERDRQLTALIAAHVGQPFDPATGPLFRTIIFRREEQDHLLLFIFHHIILDGWSMSVLQNEITTIYTARRAGKTYDLPQPLQFREYIQWNLQQHRSAAETHETYWLKHLQGPLPILELPADQPRPAVQTYQGDEQSITIAAELCQRLKDVSTRNGCTLYTTLLAGFSALLHRLTMQKDLIVGVPVAGQSLLPSGMHAEAMVGYCINMLPLRSRIEDSTTFIELLASIRDDLIEGYQHQDYSFLELIRKLKLPRDLSRALLIDATFNMDQQPRGMHQSDDTSVLISASPKTAAHFDISFNVTEGGGELVVSCYYNSDLLYPQTMRRWLRHYQTLLEGVVVDQARLLADLPLLGAAELQQLLVDWNATDRGVRGQGSGVRSEQSERLSSESWCIHHLFAAQAAATPDAIAVVFDRGQGSGVRGQGSTTPLPPPARGGTEGGRSQESGVRSQESGDGERQTQNSKLKTQNFSSNTQQLTYKELNERTNRLAHHLRVLGVGPEVRVGLCADRSVELVVGILGILKVGGAYVPLDPAYPPERLAFMLEDAGVAVLLTTDDRPLDAARGRRPTTDDRPTTISDDRSTYGYDISYPNDEQRRSTTTDDRSTYGHDISCPNDEQRRSTTDQRPQSKIQNRVPRRGESKIVHLDADWPIIAQEPATDLESGVTSANIAYVIYTSGSTGRPKGALNTHHGICNRLRWMQDAYGLAADDRVLQKTAISFDVSLWEFFWPLLTGACLVLARPEGHKDSAYLAAVIAEQRITTLHFVPAMLQVFLDEPGLPACRSLRRVISSGEALPVELQERFFARLDAELHNLYGPTEAAVDVTFWACERESTRRSVPIGRPIANTQIYLLDRQLQPVPIGVVGELYIGGAGLARGYLGRPDLTAEKFIPNPFADQEQRTKNIEQRTSDAPATQNLKLKTQNLRLYRTGDLARYLPDGAIEFLGRIDTQVKLRGLRIELGEIEAVLAQHPAVREAVVLAREEGAGDMRLVAYVVPKIEDRGLKIEDSASDAPDPLSSILDPRSSDLRRFLQERLPDYMVPSAFVTLDALPLLPNGKVDRSALPAPVATSAGTEAPRVAPCTAVEALLAGIWTEVLRVEQVGVDDNFFELGGHSLLAMQVIVRVRQAMDVELSLRNFFDAPTVSTMALLIEQRQQPAALSERAAPSTIPRRDRSAAELVAELDHLSDAEIQALLELVSQQE